jgi:pimeloyl-ACP methyl ester carboxylesterase
MLGVDRGVNEVEHRPSYLGEELANLDIPTLILWGEHDMAPVEEGWRESARIATRAIAVIARHGTSRLPAKMMTEDAKFALGF